MNPDTVQNTNQQQIQPVQSKPLPNQERPFYRRGWFRIIASLIILIFIIWPITAWIIKTVSGGSGGPKAETVFYSMLEAAGQKNTVRLHLYQEGYASNNTETKSSPEQKLLRITDYDYSQQKFNTIFATKFGDFGARAGKCIAGQEYEPSEALLDKDTFEDAIAAVNQSTVVSNPRMAEFYSACRLDRVNSAKMGDGVVPVGVSQQQVQSMVEDLKRRKAVMIKDEGETSYKNQKVRKISITVGEAAGKKEYESNRFFFSLRDGTSNKTGGNVSVADLPKHFDNTFVIQSPSGGLKGFYLVDEQTKLPVYSELSTTADGRQDFKSLFRKHAYQYNSSLTTTNDTKLEMLQN